MVVDIHSHIYPRRFAEHLRRRGQPPYVRQVDGVERFQLFDGDRGVEFAGTFQDMAAKLDFMDASGIDHSVVSVGNPWLDLDPGEATVDLAMGINDDLLDMVDRDRARLAALCVMPNDKPAAAATLIRNTASDPRCVGFVTGTEICGLPLDHEDLEPVWRTLTDTAMPLFVHPREGLAGPAAQGFGQVLTVALDFPFATTLALCRMVMSGVTVRHPQLRVVAAHGGGTLPYLLGRVKQAARVDTTSFAHPLEQMLATARDALYVDAILYSADSLEMAVGVMGESNVMFGSDHPFPIQDAVGELRRVGANGSARRVLGGNAAALFGIEMAGQ